MNRFTRLLLRGLIAGFLFFQIKSFCHRQTDGFQLHKIRSEHPFRKEWQTAGFEELPSLLSQPFTYLGSGGQSYAFVSQDRKVVLKLFKMHHLHQYPFLEHLPLPSPLSHLRDRLLKNQKEKLDNLFASCHLAFDQLKEEAGLLHLQLNPRPDSTLCVTIIDKIGIAHSLSLTDIPFALQLYAKNPFKELRLHIKRGEIQQAREIVKGIVDALKTRYEKGILDRDPALRRNIGLLDHRALFIDIGAFALSPISEQQRQEQLSRETRRMERWLAKRSPELKKYLNDLIDQS